MQVKKTFLITALPLICLEKFNPTEIEIGYLTEKIKIYKFHDHCYYSDEVVGEFEITKQQYNDFVNSRDLIIIKKTRYQIPLSAKIIVDLCIYHGDIPSTATITFTNENEANIFPKQNWFGEDVSEKINSMEYQFSKKKNL